MKNYKFVKISKSDKPNKKYYVIFKNITNGREKRIYFGSSGMSDYTIHKDIERKNRYINRHQKRENWNNPLSSGYWAKRILWNKDTIIDSLEDTINNLKELGYI